MLKHLRRVVVQFHPADPRATAARELLQRVGNPAARKTNPDCAVEHRVLEGPPPPPPQGATAAAAAAAAAGGASPPGPAAAAAAAADAAATTKQPQPQPQSFIELVFTDDEAHRLPTADLKIADVVRLIERKATEMELRAVMRDVGHDPYAAAAATKGGKAAAAAAGGAGKKR